MGHNLKKLTKHLSKLGHKLRLDHLFKVHHIFCLLLLAFVVYFLVNFLKKKPTPTPTPTPTATKNENVNKALNDLNKNCTSGDCSK